MIVPLVPLWVHALLLALIAVYCWFVLRDVRKPRK
jgi:hypothetical protein